MPTMPSSVVSSITVRVVPVSTPRLQRHGASAGTVTGVALMSMIFIAFSRCLPAHDRAADQAEWLRLERFAGPAPQEIEVAALVRLQHMVEVQGTVAATVLTSRRVESAHPPFQLRLSDVEVKPPRVCVEHDGIS